MKLTLLEMTQNILSALNSDEVNSIGDTPESLQVANAIKTTYINMLGRYEMPEHVQLINLVPSLNPEQPTLMFRPDDVTRIEWINYFNTNPAEGTQFTDQFGSYSHDLNTDLQNNANGWSTSSLSTVTIGLGTVTFTVGSGLNIFPGQTAFAQPSTTNALMSGIVISYSGNQLTLNITNSTGSGTFSVWTITQSNPTPTGPGYQKIEIIGVEDFIHMVNQFNVSNDDVGSFTLSTPSVAHGGNSTFNFNYKNDKSPQYCCIVQNYYIIFDSFDSTQDSTLQGSKTQAYAWVVPDFLMEDDFTPNLDDQQVPLLLNDAKSLAFYELKQQPHKKAEEEVARQLVSLQKWKALADHPTYFQQLPDFGRRGGGWY